MLHRKHFFLLTAAGLALSLGCRSVEEPDSAFFGEECQETVEFTNYGCIDIQGLITGTRGQPLGDIDITPGNPSEAGITAGLVVTGSSGEYELRLLKISAPSSPVTFTLKATARTSSGSEITSQTVTLTVPVAEIGETPEPVTVNFTLPIS